MTKQLQEHSAYNQFDINQDGVVTDEELDRSEKMLQIDNMDKLADQQRIMAWLALFLPFVLIIYLASGFVEPQKVTMIMSLVATFSASMGTVVVAFMAATAYVRGKMTDVPKHMPHQPMNRPLPPPPMPRQQGPML
jgi:4-hydroxybenzoate polyprenyltransferase